MAEKKKTSKKSQGRLVIAGAIVGLLAYAYWKHKQGQARASSDTIGTLPDKMPGGADSATTPIGPPPPPVIDSLTAWMAHVQSWANTLGFDPALVQTALQHYSIGQCLSGTEYEIINRALGLFGQPPNAPYQGVVKCQPGPPPDAAPEAQPYLGSGYGPRGYKKGDETHPTSAESQVLRGLDGNCYMWIPNEAASQAVGGAGEVIYIEIAPGFFVPNLTPVPVGTAAQYAKVSCPAAGGTT